MSRVQIDANKGILIDDSMGYIVFLKLVYIMEIFQILDDFLKRSKILVDMRVFEIDQIKFFIIK